jgi:hypothetical protein
MVCFRYIIVNTLQKLNDDDDEFIQSSTRDKILNTFHFEPDSYSLAENNLRSGTAL